MIIEKLDENFYYHFFNGTLNNAYEYFGAHVKKRDNEIIGCEFLLYAPNSKDTYIIGDFNNFTKQKMKEIKKGFFYFYIKKNIVNHRYKYVLNTYNNKTLYKSDPYSFYCDLRPDNNSKVYDLEKRKYKYKSKNFKNKPIVIYELHLGSWKKEDSFPNYSEIVDELVVYLKKHKFTHVELLPIYEHPLDESWGYMGTGYYAPTSRYGEPIDLMYMIDKLHKNSIKVIIDWVPGHICKDDFGLYKFDDTHLYEYDSYDIRENISWGTANLDLSKGITKSFLISNALFWIKYYKVDGFRIDAVNNLIYYLGDKSRGINEYAISFLKMLNKEIKKFDKNIIVCAEDSSAYPNVTKQNGLGFDFKWNMGWMNDSINYFKLDPLHRKFNHKLITFSFTYCFKENYILPISHDEVVHMKNSLFNKMHGNELDKFSTLRLFLGYMFFHPGKKLLFMGQEFAQKNEWDCKKQIDFHLLKNELNYKLNLYLKDLINIYLKEEVLYKTDSSLKSFCFIEPDNNEQSVFIFSRYNNNSNIIVIINALPIKYDVYKIGVNFPGYYIEIINSDSLAYAGSGMINGYVQSSNNPFHKMDDSIEIKLPPLSIVVLKLLR